MKVYVRYLGFIRSLLGTEREEILFNDGSTIRDLLNMIANKYGEKFQKEVYEPGMDDLRMGFILTVNGILMGQLNGVNTLLKEGDEVLLMTLASGG
ncbi:MAG: MoaD family protein [Candidatus Bathyarchaeia archaeon]